MPRQYIKNQPKTCTVDNCNRPTRAKGFCTLHYDRFKKHGDENYIPKNRHGLSNTPEFKIWVGIKTRCLNPKRQKYKRYGGRGIKICDRWLKSFPCFYEDMGPRPTPKHQIDRINNDGNYEPSNCRWILPAENARNSTATKLTKKQVEEIRESYSFRKVTHKDLSKRFGVCTDTIQKIIHKELWR